jgi:hypothetical protein
VQKVRAVDRGHHECLRPPSHQVSFAAADWPTALDGQRTSDQREWVAVTGQFRPVGVAGQISPNQP